jgi:predicted PurR-regulated permease PerM
MPEVRTPIPPAPASTPAPTTRPDWRSLHLWQIQPVRDGLVIAVVIGLVWLGSRLSVVTVPLLLALLLSYLFEPLVQKITRTGRIKRKAVAAGLILLVAVVVVVPVCIGATFAVSQGIRFVTTTANRIELVMNSVAKPEDTELRDKVPHGPWVKLRDFIVEQQTLRKKLSPREPGAGAPTPAPGQTPVPPAAPAAPSWGQATTETVTEAAPEQSDLYNLVQYVVAAARENAGDLNKRLLAAGTGLLGGAVGLVGSVGRLIFGGILTAFFFFFMCTGWGRVLSFGQSLVPERRQGRVLDLIRKMDRVIAGFVRGRLTVAAIMMVLYSIGYWLAGMPAPLILGPVVGALVIIPFSNLITTPLVILLTFLDPPLYGFRSEWWWCLVGPMIVGACCQSLDDYILNPRIQGKHTQMDVPTILFASIAGGALAGFYGLLVAIPTAACVKILLNEVFWPRFRAWSHGEAPDILPIKE